jgi:DNA-binding transcriptional LysR family regulator
VGEVSRTLVASPAFLKRNKRPKAPRDLAQCPAILFSGAGNSAHFLFQNEGKKVQVPVQGALRSNDAQVSIDACADGLGYGQFLSYQVEDLIAEGKLVALLKKHQLPVIPVQVVFPHTRLLAARTRVLVNWLKEHLGPPP